MQKKKIVLGYPQYLGSVDEVNCPRFLLYPNNLNYQLKQ